MNSLLNPLRNQKGHQVGFKFRIYPITKIEKKVCEEEKPLTLKECGQDLIDLYFSNLKQGGGFLQMYNSKVMGYTLIPCDLLQKAFSENRLGMG